MKKKSLRILLVLIFSHLYFWLGASSFSPAFADYTDQITVKSDEAWRAAIEVLGRSGFRKKMENPYYLETQWAYDRVPRSRGLLKKIASKIYERRYRFKIWINQRDYDTEIKISGKFQERPLETKPSLLWRQVKPDLADLDMERQTFMKILMALEKARQTPA